MSWWKRYYLARLKWWAMRKRNMGLMLHKLHHMRCCKKKIIQNSVEWMLWCWFTLVFLISALDLSLPSIFLVTSRIFILFSLILVENFTTSHCWETPYLVTSANGVTSNEELLGRPLCICVMAGHQLLKSCRHAMKAQTGQAARCRSSWIAHIIWPTTAKSGCWLTWA